MIYNILKDRAVGFFNKAVVIDDYHTYDYNDLFKRAEDLAEQLSKDLKVRDRVLLYMENSCAFICSFLALSKIGAIVIPVSCKMNECGIEEFVYLNNINYIIANKLVDISGCKCWEINKDTTYIEKKIDNIIKMKPNAEDLEGVAEILYTSGTTGVPKGIMLTDENVIHNIKAISEYLNIDESDTTLIIKPFHHVSTLNGEILTSLYNGSTIITTSKILTKRLVKNIITKHKISCVFMTPTLISCLLLGQLESYSAEAIERLKIIHFYGATITDNTLRELLDEFPHSEIIYSYGLTEASPRVSYIKRKDIVRKVGSSGVPLGGVHISIYSDEGELIEQPNVIGNLFVKGPNIMKGYYGNPALSKSVLTEEGLRTGDIGYLDEEGYLYVKGRKDNMIIKNGVNIYPMEIENIIKKCAFVCEVYVKGIKDNITGEKIIAYVTKKSVEEDKNVINEVLRICHQYLEAFKIPDIVKIEEKLEKTESGKIKRM